MLSTTHSFIIGNDIIGLMFGLKQYLQCIISNSSYEYNYQKPKKLKRNHTGTHASHQKWLLAGCYAVARLIWPIAMYFVFQKNSVRCNQRNDLL